MSRETLRRWTRSAWVVHWRGEEVRVEGRRFSAGRVASTLTDAQVRAAGFAGQTADDLDVGESTWLEVEVGPTAPAHQQRTLRYRVERVA